MTTTTKRAFALAMLALSLAACGASDGSTDDLVVTQGSACSKDRDALERIRSTPHSCTTGDACPTGSHCDIVAERCAWQCFSDSDCGAGATCTCDGQCVGGNANAIGDDPPAECERVVARLRELQSTPRSCGFDEECPNGSHCDASTGQCAFACMATTDCAAGTECDCFGRCVAPGATSQAADSTRRLLTATPMGVELKQRRVGQTRVEFEPVPVQLVLRTSDRDAPAPRVIVRAPEPLRIVASADAPADGDSGWTRELVFPSWEFTAQPRHTYVATKRVWVKALANTDTATGPWTLTMVGSDVDTSAAVTVQAKNPDADNVATGLFVGELIDISSGQDGIARVPVTIWATDTFALFLDDSRALSPSGVFGTTRDGAKLVTRWLSSDTGPMTTTVNLARRGTDPPPLPLAENILEVTLPFTPPQVLRFRIAAKRIDNVPASTSCTTNAQCGTGAYCETRLNRCAPGDSWLLNGQAMNGLTHPQADTWVSASAWMLTNNTPGLFGVPAVPGPKGLAYSLMCFPTGTRTYEGATNFPAGFQHATGQTYASMSGDMKTPLATCSQVAPLVISRDTQLEYQPPAPGPTPDANAPVVDASRLLAECASDLMATPPRAPDGVSAKANAWFGRTARCASLSRLFPLLDWLTPPSTTARPRGGTESRILQRVIAQWLAVISFQAKQAANQSSLDAVLTQDSNPNDPTSLANTLTRLEQSLDLVLRKRVADTLTAQSRDALRYPDYRDVRPVAYYTFDPEDMNGRVAHDLVGESNLTIPVDFTPATPSAKYIHNASPTTPIAATFGRGGAELSGDLLITIKTAVPSIAAGERKVLLEYGDENNLFYQFSFRGNSASRPELYAYHGVRSNAVGGAVRISNAITPTTGPGNMVTMVIRRRADYAANAGSVSWTSEYRSYINNGEVIERLTSPIPTTFTTRSNNQAPGLLNIYGSVDELAIWDEALDGDALTSVLSATTVSDDVMLRAVSTALNVPVSDNHDQDVGLAPQLLEATAEYVRASAVDVTGRVVGAHASCSTGSQSSPSRRIALERFGRSMRYAWSMQALAGRLQSRADTRGCTVDADCSVGQTCRVVSTDERVCAAGTTPVNPVPMLSYRERYTRAVRDLDAARAELLAAARPLVTCDDPMGIPEDALPLFFGDLTGTSSRFFAASDYLLNTWARPAVDRATSALEAARTAWISKRSSEVQQLQTEHDRERRLEQLALSHAAPIAELCGLTDVDGLQVLPLFESGVLTTENCFLRNRPDCVGEAAMSNAECVRGTLGSTSLAILSAKQDVEVAQADALAAEQRYEAESLFCTHQRFYDEREQDYLGQHVLRMQDLRRKRGLLSAYTGFLGGLGGAMASGGSPLSGIASGYEAIGHYLDFEMSRAEDSYRLHSNFEQMNARARQCFHGANQLKLAIDAPQAQVRARTSHIYAAALEMQNRKDEVKRHVQEGLAALRREENRTVPSVAHHYWLDERIDRFRVDFAWARRLTYLAVRAVEYEFQQSLTLEEDVLRARNPGELLNVIIALDQEQAGRTINGRRPEETSVVLSLRDDILRTFDRSHPLADAPAGERYWSATRRFAETLRSPRFAMYDDDGDYLGQGIPFAMTATGPLAYRCAERLWRVNATVQGDVIEASTPSVPVILLKRNTFSSQWCDGRSDDDSVAQIGSVRPTADLFRPGASAGSDGETGGFSSALLFPWFNVVRSEFYRSQYLEGGSEELAGRGLYGDYVLLFPESGLLEWTDDDLTNDFPLTRVEDVLIRFDLLSVDNLSL